MCRQWTQAIEKRQIFTPAGTLELVLDRVLEREMQLEMQWQLQLHLEQCQQRRP